MSLSEEEMTILSAIKKGEYVCSMYLDHIKDILSHCDKSKQDKLMATYHAVESVWCALVNLKGVLDE